MATSLNAQGEFEKHAAMEESLDCSHSIVGNCVNDGNYQAHTM